MNQKEKKKKRSTPAAALLAVVVVVAAVIMAVIIFGTRPQEGSQQVQKTQEEKLTEKDEIKQVASTEASSESESKENVQSEVLESQKYESEKDSETDLQKDERKETENSSETDSEKSTEKGGSSLSVAVDKTREETAAASESSRADQEGEEESESETEERLTVAIDPGHQGSWVNMTELEPNGPGSSEMKAKATTGTQGRYSGKKEYELNLEVSLLLRDELEGRGYRVVLTREDHDTAISNAERAELAWEEGGDIYVRIHANGSDSAGAKGALAMVPSSSNPYVGSLAADSYLLGESILNAYCSKASFDNLGVQYYDNMSGINWSRLPVMILEMGFMTNESDDLRMADTATQKLMAEGIADGIDQYFLRKGLKQIVPSAEEQTAVDTCMEILGESFLYPAIDQGEQWAVSLLNLDTYAESDIHGDVRMESASVIKVFLMAAIYDRVCYPSSEDRYIPFPESYEGELRQLITDMITVSDNEAANTLLKGLGQGDAKAGMDVVNQFCRENGYTGTSFGRMFLEENPTGDNYTTANDCRELLESIYRGTCVGQEASAKMYEYLKQQTRLWKIPAGLEGLEVKTANKTGELAGEYGSYVENDIAVIETEKGNYVLCILSGALQDNQAAQQRLQKMSKVVYENLFD
ncbi:MAG: N-acetylmuramoyl-L-alanine amidase [Lachnospiraceae bacterium]|nr:N-acetylmuramoyl-L-alanine amidase [Lachnospiraceae bacterium]